MRPIDADALIAKWEEDAKHMDSFDYKMMVYGAINDMKKQPTIDIAERRGKWILVQHPIGHDSVAFYKCSECNCANWIKEDNYCPNCGAKMEEEES